MRVLKTAVASGNSILTIDTIEYDGGLWLVLAWVDSPDRKLQVPHRILRIDQLAHTRPPKKIGPHDIVLHAPIPVSVLEGGFAPGFVVVDRPDIKPFVNPQSLN